MLFLLIISENTFCQYVNGPVTLSSPNTSGSHSSNTRVTLAPGFTSAVPFNAFIQVPATPSNNMNYVMTYTPRTEITDLSLLPMSTTSDVNKSIQYFDGLGRPIQTVNVQASPTMRDFVEPVIYDKYGRQAVKYLPYSILPTSLSDGSYKTTAIANQGSFYANPANWSAPGVAGTSFPTSATQFEASPLNRPIDQGAPGDAWQLAGTPGASNPGHTNKIIYASNDATSLTSGSGYWAKNYSVDYVYSFDGNYLYQNTLTDLGAYTANTLYVTKVRNENWLSTQSNLNLNTTEEYKDKFGHLICKRTFNYNKGTSTAETLSTYYVYDDYGNLTYVLPPAATPDNGITSDELENYCYQYRYDGRNRMVGKKIPGKGWELYLYNRLDQPVGTQDAVQRNKSTQEWSVIKYDAMGRQIITGTYQYGSTPGTDNRAALQSLVDGQGAQWERPQTSGNGYTTNTWPATWTTTLTLNYYDDYVNMPTLPYTTFTAGSKMTRGTLTANKTLVLNTTNMLWTQHYYDYKNREIQSFIQHYLGGTAHINNYDDVSTTYNFSDTKDITRLNYRNATGNVKTLNVTLKNAFTYDHTGRVITKSTQINAAPAVINGNYVYNEVNQLYQKKLHSENGGSSFIETVTNSYNPRGWTTNISSPNFSEQLYYEGISGQIAGETLNYNGNITESWYSSPAVANKGFYYTYDNINRLDHAKYYSGSTYNGALDETISYDVNGNIQQLVRGSYGARPFTYSGTFDYSNYTGNQVGTVKNNTAAYQTYTYDENGNAKGDGTYNYDYNLLNLPNTVKHGLTLINTYTYNANGTKLRKVNAASGDATDYIAGIQFKNSVIDFIETPEGRYENTGSPVFQYMLKDHLGNNRVLIQKNTATTASAIQEQEYYAFGLNVTRNDNSADNKYLYNGKELQDEDNFNKLDYGARFYDPVIGRFTGVDPKAEFMRRYSTYNYGFDNPIRFIDPDGRGPNDVILGGSDKQKALAELQKSVQGQLNLSMDANGKVSYTPVQGATAGAGATQLKTAIDDHSVTVNVDATGNKTTSTGHLFIGGAFAGNTVTPASTPGGTATVSAKQEINPTVLGASDAPYGKAGENTLHEVTEAYQGAKLSQASGVSSGPANTPGSVYPAAHAAATPQAGAINETIYDASGHVLTMTPQGGYPSNVAKVEWSVTGTNGNRTVIQTLP